MTGGVCVSGGPAMKYNVRTCYQPTDDLWDDFVSAMPGGSHLQSTSWARLKVRHGWRTARIIATNNEHIVAGGQMLGRSLPFLGTVAYLPKGPILQSTDTALADDVLEAAESAARAWRARLISIQPADDGRFFESRLLERGYCPVPIELAPTCTLVIDLFRDVEQILQSMRRQTRQNILRGRREGIQVRKGNRCDIEGFTKLYAMASRRLGFAPYPSSYFVNMWDTLSASGNIALFVAEHSGVPVSALLVILFKDRVIAKTLAWSGYESSRRPNDAVFWAAIEWAKATGYRLFDFGGVDRTVGEAVQAGDGLSEAIVHSPWFFKLKYGGRLVLSPVTYISLLNPVLMKAFNLARRHVDVCRAALALYVLLKRVLVREGRSRSPAAGLFS